jgi:hypothetical protein
LNTANSSGSEPSGPGRTSAARPKSIRTVIRCTQLVELPLESVAVQVREMTFGEIPLVTSPAKTACTL